MSEQNFFVRGLHGRDFVRRAASLTFALSWSCVLATAQTDEVFSTIDLIDDLNQALSDKPVVIASGPAASMNYVTAGLLCEVLARSNGQSGPSCLVRPTENSAENVELLISGAVSLALVQSDREYFAAQSLGPYAGMSDVMGVRRIAAIAGLPVQVVTKAQGGFTDITQLEARRVGLGGEGTAQRLIGRVVLSAAGVQERGLSKIDGNEPAQQVREFCANELDAVILPTSAPSPLVAEMMRRCDGKILPLVADGYDNLINDNSYLVSLEIPADTYPNQPEPVASFGYVMSLVGLSGQRSDLIEAFAGDFSLVYGSLASRFDGIGLVPADKIYDLGRSAPLHQGVERFLSLVHEGAADRVPPDQAPVFTENNAESEGS